MSRDWKPGAVVMWQPDLGIPQVLFRDGYNETWVSDDDGECYVEPQDALRLLAVIDPEDREQVERLRDLMDAAYFDQSEGALDFPAVYTGARGNALQAALRALIAEPETPPEPTGLGAVVRDIEGRLWVRTDANEWTADGDYTDDYRSLVAVEVLSPGVTPDSPAPDDRPLIAGERVRVSSTALSPMAGRVVRFWVLKADGTSLVYEDGTPNFRHIVDSTQITRFPDEEATR